MTTKVELDETARKWLEAYKVAKARLADDEAIVERCREQLVSFLGEAEVATVDGKDAVRHIVVNSNRLDTKKLKEQRPDVYEEFSKPQVTRRFTVVDK